MSESRTSYRTRSRAGSKYGNRKVEWNGELFHSQAELSDYILLLSREHDGEIGYLRRQVPYLLQESFRDNEGIARRAIVYVADFVFLEQGGQTVVWDTKGFASREFAIKHKLFLKRYPTIKFVLSKQSTVRKADARGLA